MTPKNAATGLLSTFFNVSINCPELIYYIILRSETGVVMKKLFVSEKRDKNPGEPEIAITKDIHFGG